MDTIGTYVQCFIQDQHNIFICTLFGKCIKNIIYICIIITIKSVDFQKVIEISVSL